MALRKDKVLKAEGWSLSFICWTQIWCVNTFRSCAVWGLLGLYPFLTFSQSWHLYFQRLLLNTGLPVIYGFPNLLLINFLPKLKFYGCLPLISKVFFILATMNYLDFFSCLPHIIYIISLIFTGVLALWRYIHLFYFS